MQNISRLKHRIGIVIFVTMAVVLSACNDSDFSLKGEVSGLVGTGLVLLNNSEDSVRVNHNGAFEFDLAYPYAYPYLVTVGVQPVAPAQTCVVTNSSGRLTEDVSNVRVDCTTMYTVGGAVTGLQGTGLVLKNNGTDNLTITAGGDFNFAKSIVDGEVYEVTVSTQPDGQHCDVINGKGSIVGANVTNVQVTCGTLTVGGTVTGLSGTLTIQSQLADDLTLTANGDFTFATALVDGTNYKVTVLTQPTGQRCSVVNGTGKLAGANITNVEVRCGFTVGGSLSGLEADLSVTLQNNGGDDLELSLDNSFTFNTALNKDDSYNVTVAIPPPRQSCSVSNGSGTIASSGITNVTVNCRLGPTVSVDYGIKRILLSWEAVSDTEVYRVMKSTDAGVNYSQIGVDTTGLTYVETVPVHLTDWVDLRYKVQACSDSANSATCNDSNIVTGIDELQAIGYAKASNTASGDNFGHALALSGDGNTLAIGAVLEDGAGTGVNNGSPGQSDDNAPDSGAVYVYTRDTVTGEWSQQAYVKASNTEALDNFGSALALSENGNTLVVGAPGEDSASTGINDTTPGEGDNSASASGAVYVFSRSGANWSQQAYVKASNTGAQDNFGYALALSDDGNTLAVGAYFEDSAATVVGGNEADNTAANSGAVYVFAWDGAVWNQQAYVKASNSDAGDQFGSALALSATGDTLAVGARNEDSSSSATQSDNSALESGAVYVFTRAATVWSQQAYVKASNTGAGDLFGNTLALSDDGSTLAVGAYLEDSASGSAAGAENNVPDSGAAYVFTRSGVTWSQQSFVKAANLESGDQFGFALALSGDGDILVVSANLEDSAASGIDDQRLNNLAPASGASYVFTRSSSVWTEHGYVKASNTDVDDNFGDAVALSDDGDTLIVGADSEDSVAAGLDGDQVDNSSSDSGAVYIY